MHFSEVGFWVSNLSETVGKNFEFQCSAKGFPELRFSNFFAVFFMP